MGQRGDFLFHLRGELSQGEAAACVGVNRVAWNRWENEHNVPRIDHIAKIAAWSGTPLEGLIQFLTHPDRVDPPEIPTGPFPPLSPSARSAPNEWAIRSPRERHRGIEGEPWCARPWRKADTIDNLRPTCPACVILAASL